MKIGIKKNGEQIHKSKLRRGVHLPYTGKTKQNDHKSLKIGNLKFLIPVDSQPIKHILRLCLYGTVRHNRMFTVPCAHNKLLIGTQKITLH